VQDSEFLQLDLNNNGILPLTPNDPGRRNALSEAMLSELSAAFARVCVANKPQ